MDRSCHPSGMLGKFLLTLISSLLVVGLLAGCAAPQPTPTPTKAAAAPTTAPAAKPTTAAAKPDAKSEAKPAAASKEPYKVGFVRPSTGPVATTLENVIKGVRLATELVNNSGGLDGHKIDLIEYDDEANPEKTITAVKRVIEQDKAVALIGPTMNAVVRAAKPLLKNGPVAVFLTSSGTPEPDSYGFQALITTKILQQKLFQYLKKTNYKKVVLLATTDSTGEDAVTNVTAIAKQIGGVEVVVERYNVNDVDVTPQLTKVRADKDIQAIIIWSTGQQVAIPIKNAAQLGIDLPIYVSPANHSNNFLKLIQGNEPKTLWLGTTRGYVWYDLPDSDPIKKIAASYADPYQAKYGELADQLSFNGIDGAKLIYDALKAAGPDSKKMKEWIESQSSWQGAGFAHRYSKDNHEGDYVEAAVLTVLKDGKWRIIE